VIIVEPDRLADEDSEALWEDCSREPERFIGYFERRVDCGTLKSDNSR